MVDSAWDFERLVFQYGDAEGGDFGGGGGNDVVEGIRTVSIVAQVEELVAPLS